ncbi:MAG: hypothetical protein M3O31_07255 [Acidobacteriota bacterium]|nr:hypothetical protein [Acidobacteriota bacterium]
MAKRSAQEVIDNAIRENRPNEYLLYGFALLFVGLGTGSFIYSVLNGHWALSIGSAIESGLFYPALNAVQKIRRENQKIRLLELALTNAKTADEAAIALGKIFLQEFSDNRGSTDVRTKKHSG